MAGAAWTGLGVIGQLAGGFLHPLSSLGLGLLLVCAGGLHPFMIGFKLCLKASPVACSSLVCVSNNLELVSLSWRLGYRLFPECALWLHRGAGIRLSCAVAGVCPVGAAVLQTLPWPGQELRLWTEPGINLGSFWPWVH